MIEEQGKILLIFQIFGFFHRKRSLAQLFHFFLFIYSIVNGVSGFAIVKFPGEYGITDLVGMLTFYLSLVAHVALLLSSSFNKKQELKIFEGLKEFDSIFSNELPTKKKYTRCYNNKNKVFIKVLCGWLIVVVVNMCTTASVIQFGFYTEYWTRALFGRVSSYIKALQVLYLLELLKIRFEVIETILDTFEQDDHSENTLLLLKKMYGKVFEISIDINKLFRTDLGFIVLIIFFVALTNFYWGCLIIAELVKNTSMFGEYNYH